LSDREGQRTALLRLTPMLLYTAVYLATCLVGAFLLLLDWRTFVAYFEYFSGTEMPNLSRSELATTLVLLLIAPVLMWFGFLVVTYLHAVPLDRAIARVAGARLDAPPAVPVVVFAVSLAAAIGSLASAGSFSHLGSWLQYTDWVTARQTVFAEVGFAEFANIYLLLPLSAAWIAVSRTPRGRGLVVIALATTFAVAVQLLLFQKKAAMVAALIVLTALAVHARGRAATQRLRWVVLLSLLAMVATYFTLVVLPVYAQTRQTVQTVVAPEGEPRPAAGPRAPAEQERREKLARELNLDNHTKSIAIYALLSPLTRTSAASLYYADVFPRRHAFYGLGLGDGKPTDDTRVVWDYMNPNLPGGTIAAPFQFGMFALWGPFGALAACLVAGAGLALLWRIVLAAEPAHDWHSMGASLVLLLAVYLAIDSAQNGFLVSYGVVWGLLALGAAIAVAAFVRRERAAPR
jgi:MFS family permease